MFVPKQEKICSLSLHKNGSEFSEEKILIVPNHQHGLIYCFFYADVYCSLLRRCLIKYLVDYELCANPAMD